MVSSICSRVAVALTLQEISIGYTAQHEAHDTKLKPGRIVVQGGTSSAR